MDLLTPINELFAESLKKVFDDCLLKLADYNWSGFEKTLIIEQLTKLKKKKPADFDLLTCMISKNDSVNTGIKESAILSLKLIAEFFLLGVPETWDPNILLQKYTNLWRTIFQDYFDTSITMPELSKYEKSLKDYCSIQIKLINCDCLEIMKHLFASRTDRTHQLKAAITAFDCLGEFFKETTKIYEWKSCINTVQRVNY